MTTPLLTPATFSVPGARHFDADTVRNDFPILHQTLAGGHPLVYLDSAATAQKPRAVLAKIVECYEQYNSNVHRGIHQLGDRMTTELEDAREKVRGFLGAQEVDDVIFTSGTTMSLNLVALGYAGGRLKPGDEILVNEMEHHANLVPWQMVAKATGATLRYLPLTAEGELNLADLSAVLTTRTKIVAVTAVSNVLGTINPISLLAKAAHDVGAVIVVDGAQSVPHGPVNVVAQGIDFLAFSGHKLYGPTGVGVLCVRRELQDQMDPVFGGGHMIREVFKDHSTWSDGPAKFEAGTAPYIEAVALGTAIDYVTSLGWDGIHEHEQQLTDAAWTALKEIPGLTILGPGPKRRGAILSFVVDGVHPHDLSDLLDRQGVAIRAGHHCTMPLHDLYDLAATARASFGIYNTVAEVDALASAIRAARKVFKLPE